MFKTLSDVVPPKFKVGQEVDRLTNGKYERYYISGVQMSNTSTPSKKVYHWYYSGKMVASGVSVMSPETWLKEIK